MKQRPDGDFDVSPGEKITITAERDNPPCVVTFGPAKGCSCGTASSPNGTSVREICTSPVTPGLQWEQTIIFAFPAVEGGTPNNHYRVTLSGDQGGKPVQDDVNAPPDPRDRTYTFHVSAS